MLGVEEVKESPFSDFTCSLNNWSSLSQMPPPRVSASGGLKRLEYLEHVTHRYSDLLGSLALRASGFPQVE